MKPEEAWKKIAPCVLNGGNLAGITKVQNLDKEMGVLNEYFRPRRDDEQAQRAVRDIVKGIGFINAGLGELRDPSKKAAIPQGSEIQDAFDDVYEAILDEVRHVVSRRIAREEMGYCDE